MNILDTLAARFGFYKASQPIPGVLLAEADSHKWDMPSATVAEKQAMLYTLSTWISTAVDHVAGIGSSGVFSVKRTGQLQDSDADDEDIPNHPFELLLRKPNPAQSRGEFLRDALSFYKITGNLYLFLNAASEGAPPDELWVIPSQLMKPLPDGKSYIRGYEFMPVGQPAQFIPRWQVLHMKTFNPNNPFVGLSAIQSLATDAYTDLAQSKWNLKTFDKDNGTLPVIVAFKNMIENTEWSRIKREAADRSSFMMMRGVGDALQLLQATATPKDMEFLAARGFNKEEIYDKLAPGLASILAVNATEANAIAGKSTLIDLGVMPLLEQLAQKFSSDLLTLYGDGLVGEFDDMRQTNRILDLQEQAEYAKYHTVNEVRSMYYDEEPLELDPTVIKAIEVKDAAQAEMDANPPAPSTAVVPFGKADTMPVNKLDPRGFLFPAQISPTTPNPADVAKPTPPMVPPQPPMNQPPGSAAQDANAPADQAAQAAKADELAKWEKFATARLGKSGRKFEPRVLELFEAARIKASLKTVKTEPGVRAVFAVEREEPDELSRLAAAIEAATAKL